MSKYLKPALLFLFVGFHALAQKNITIEEIFTGGFRAKGMDALQAMSKSNQYTVLNFDRSSRNTTIDLYDFATLKKVGTIINTEDYPELQGIDSYSFSSDENLVLIANNTAQIFRHSFTADYFLYNRTTKKLIKLFDQVQEPLFSPTGTHIAFAKNNNLFIYSVSTGNINQLTQDGVNNQIINGITDWVYEEEFAFVRAFDWSADGQQLAYIKFDESQVPEFSMTTFNKNLYPKTVTFKYPKAGEKNAKVSLHIFKLSTAATQNINLDQYTDFYIPRIKWTKEPSLLSAQIINRHQNNLDLLFIDGETGQTKVMLNESDKAYIDITDNLTFLKDNSFIWTSEKDGYNHIYHYNSTGTLKQQVTKGLWEVTGYYGVDEKSQTLFYQSVETGSINRAVYRIQLNGKNKVKLSTALGFNNATFSPDFSRYINAYASAKTPPYFSLHDARTGKELQKIVSNETLLEKVQQYALPDKEFTVITTGQGNQLNAWIMKPTQFDASKKYPLLMYQYSGPGSQQVDNNWNGADDYWFAMLTQKGYVVACVDGRGTGYKGAAFKKITQKQLGKYEVEDQIEAAKIFGGYPYIDASRIGIFGWSYGGFMAANCILKGSEVFKTAISVAPVTNWRFYDSIYTERYMQTPQENPSGYDDNSPINHVDKLRGNLLLIHGSADDNVHVQNSMQMIEALVQANKQFDSEIYPDKHHGISGGKTRIQLYHRMTNYLLEHL